MRSFISMEPIHKGWSADEKYCVRDEAGGKYLLRRSAMEQYSRKKGVHERMCQVAALEVPMCYPVEFGLCDGAVYTLQSWIEGVDAEEAIPAMGIEAQLAYGQEAGGLLRKIHSIPAPADQWEIRYHRKIDTKIKRYNECPLKYDQGQSFIDYINENRHLLRGRPQVYQHGDYHIGNMMVGNDGTLYIIDFERDDFGDPWEEFNRIVWCAQKAPAFACGMVNEYFDGEVPQEFWNLLALYISANTLSSLYWAVSFGEKEIHTMMNQAREVLLWYDHLQNPIPTWYTETMAAAKKQPSYHELQQGGQP